ncbi:MAG TPA: RNA polymerase sigma factor [Oceanobacillus sp.]|nr:RNA polymerase sigma factor [Oceanobacillus sp.]
METRALIEATFRQEHGRVLAALISQLGSFDLAEDALQDAIVIALRRWDTDGIPQNPGAWLTTVAKRRAIDRLRHASTIERASILQSLNNEQQENDEMDSIPDERLKLMFTCCHPSLAQEAQVALTLRTLGGLTTAEIARAFLVPLPTMAQRLTRAKIKIREAGIPYRIPPAHLLPERLEALLQVIYLIFNEGYKASSGDTLIRHELCSEAIRLGRVLVELLPPDHACCEARGLLALMLLHNSRRHARINAEGELVLLEDQDRSLWDQDEIEEGIALLQATLAQRCPGPYQVQAAISAVHAEAKRAEDTDWKQIADLYHILMIMTPSPVIEVNRAVALGMAHGTHAGLRLLYHLSEEMDDYFPYHAARADLLRRANEREAAADAYERALALCENNLERAYLQRRLKELNA